MDEGLALTKEEFNQIEFAERDLFEIDFEDYGFSLYTELGSNRWLIKPYDEDQEEKLVHDPKENTLFSNIVEYNGVSITPSMFQQFQDLEEKEREA